MVRHGVGVGRRDGPKTAASSANLHNAHQGNLMSDAWATSTRDRAYRAYQRALRTSIGPVRDPDRAQGAIRSSPCALFMTGARGSASTPPRGRVVLATSARLGRNGGEGGIRTRDGLPRTAFPVRRHSPLGDLSPIRGNRPDQADRFLVTSAGGEGGIRTRGAFAHRFSRAAPSTTRTPLREEDTKGPPGDHPGMGCADETHGHVARSRLTGIGNGAR